MNENDNQPTDEQIIQGIEFATEKQRAKNALIAFGIIFTIGYLGGKAGGRAALKEVRGVLLECEEMVTVAKAAADLAADNADITYSNGKVVLAAIKKTPVDDAVKALKDLRTN